MTTPSPLAESTEPPIDWRDSPLTANVWLLFLGFPLLSVVFGDGTPGVKALLIVLIAVFAGVHVLGYRAAAKRNRSGRDDLDRLPVWDPLSPWLYLGGLVVLQVVSILIGGTGLLGLMPFIVTFGLFNFSWRTGGIVLALCVATSILLPALAGRLSEFWFFPILMISVAAGAGFSRMSEESMSDRAALEASLAVSAERNRVARDVHDLLGHSLTAVILKSQVCAILVDSVKPTEENDQRSIDSLKAELVELETVARQAMAEVRSTVGGLRVATLADEIAAARAVLADASVKLTVQGSADTAPEKVEATLAWVVRESVTNIVRHAKADNCTITIGGSANGSGRLIRITDDGVGLTHGSAANGDRRSGNGLRGMRERVEDAGVEFLAGPGPDGVGTMVEVTT